MVWLVVGMRVVPAAGGGLALWNVDPSDQDNVIDRSEYVWLQNGATIHSRNAWSGNVYFEWQPIAFPHASPEIVRLSLESPQDTLVVSFDAEYTCIVTENGIERTRSLHPIAQLTIEQVRYRMQHPWRTIRIRTRESGELEIIINDLDPISVKIMGNRYVRWSISNEPRARSPAVSFIRNVRIE